MKSVEHRLQYLLSEETRQDVQGVISRLESQSAASKAKLAQIKSAGRDKFPNPAQYDAQCKAIEGVIRRIDEEIVMYRGKLSKLPG